jgi:hypothetical protein
MAIQIYNPHITEMPKPAKRSFSEKLTAGAGNLAESLEEIIKEHEKKKKEKEEKASYAKGLENLETQFADNPEQKKILKVYQELAKHPEQAKQIGSQLSQHSKRPLNDLEQEQLNQLKSEEDYLSQIMGGGQQDNQEQPTGTNNAIQGRSEFGATPERGQGAPRKQPQRTFDFNTPSTWTDQQVNNFRTYQGKSLKAQTFREMAEEEHVRRKDVKKEKTKYLENVLPLEGALEIIERMEQIGRKGSLGIGTTVRGILSPKARKEASEYERLGKSLISYSTNIPIRNRSEFEVLAEDLFDASLSDASREGILQAMKRILQTSMKQYVQPEDEGMQTRQPRQPPRQQERPPLTSFLR